MFSFKTDEKAEAFCQAIIGLMVRMFAIPEEEAIGRLNEKWRGLEFTWDDDELFRESPEWWAKNIYYGHGWWNTKESELKPLPFPRPAPPATQS